MNILLKGLKNIEEKFKDEHSSSVTNESQWFSDYYHKWRHHKSSTVESSYKAIPKFYDEVTEKNDESSQSMLQIEARSMQLQKISDDLLDNEELEDLRAILNNYSSGSDNTIGYKDLKELITKASIKCKDYYSAKTFSQLQKGKFMKNVDIWSLFTYAMRKTWQKKTRIGLSVYDSSGKGYLREVELESFVSDIIPDCSQLNGLKQSFHPFYICTVVRKIMFFLDPMRTGKIRLREILASNFLDDFLVLRNNEIPEELEESNWFSASSALNVYGQYLTLDKDGNGMLSKKELSAYGTGTLTEVFIDRVFQECLTYEGEMDYKAYLEFVLALENKQEHQSQRYYFRILDINHSGYLDAFSINFFFRGIQEEMKKHHQDPVSFEDIKDELFDMVRPVDPTKITFNDLINCQKGEYFVSILTDLNEFWNYENRECN